jgi:hypothetical protein
MEQFVSVWNAKRRQFVAFTFCPSRRNLKNYKLIVIPCSIFETETFQIPFSKVNSANSTIDGVAGEGTLKGPTGH